MMNSNRRMKKRPRNQATRYRLVGQVLGQQGVQKVVTTVKQIKQLQSIPKNLLVLVDAWESAPIDDLKSLPWEEMLRTALGHLETMQQAESTK